MFKYIQMNRKKSADGSFHWSLQQRCNFKHCLFLQCQAIKNFSQYIFTEAAQCIWNKWQSIAQASSTMSFFGQSCLVESQRTEKFWVHILYNSIILDDPPARYQLLALSRFNAKAT